MTVRIKVHAGGLTVERGESDTDWDVAAATTAHLAACLAEGMCPFGHPLSTSRVPEPIGRCDGPHSAEGDCWECGRPYGTRWAIHGPDDHVQVCQSLLVDPYAERGIL